MKPLSQTLSNLIVLAEEFITRPQMVDRAMVGDRLSEISDDVRRADARPAENVRTTRAALVMVVALEEFRSSETSAAQWSMVAGAMLPLLREEAYIAFRNERAQQ